MRWLFILVMGLAFADAAAAQAVQAQKKRRPPSMAWMAGVFGAVAAAAAAKQLQRSNEELEDSHIMTETTPTEYEYKILRGSLSSFKKRENLNRALEEESRAGWELFEKLDDCRLRLRRPVSRRDGDAHLEIDAYRSTFGAGDSKVAVYLIFGVLAAIGIIITMFVLIK